MRALATLVGITTQIAEDVREAVDKIVDAFQAFVIDGALQLVVNTMGPDVTTSKSF